MKADPEYANLVKDVLPSMEELFHAGEQVVGLMAHPGWQYVLAVVEAARDGIDARLDGELLPTRSDYARLTGKRAGMKAMEEAARAIVGRAESKLAEQQHIHEPTAEPVA